MRWGEKSGDRYDIENVYVVLRKKLLLFFLLFFDIDTEFLLFTDNIPVILPAKRG